MPGAALLSLVLLAACQEVSPPPALPATATQDKAAGSSSSGAAASSEDDASSDAWSQLADRLGDLDGGARATALRTALENRARARKLEDQQIEGALVSLQTQLIRSCKVEEAQPSFSALQGIEAASLLADRVLLSQALDLAGPDGRQRIWQAGDADEVLGRPREVMIARAQSALPLWVAGGATDEARLEAQRQLLALNLMSEATAIRGRAELAAFSNAVVAMDLSAPDLPAAVAAGLELVDARLLAEQNTRFTALVEACAEMPAQQWMLLVAGGTATSYIGMLGGSNGVGDPSDRRVSSTSAMGSSFAMSMTQSGGMGGASSGQMGGQMGGGQMGGQLGGGQMGGGQMGGQMGGGQMGGQLGGGQMGGGQMGGMSPGGANMSGQSPGGMPGSPGTGFPGGQAGGPGAASSTMPSGGGAGGPPSAGNANPR